MRIGDHDLPRDQARDHLCGYARQHVKTVLWYDLAGDEDGRPGPVGAARPVNSVTPADIGRLVLPVIAVLMVGLAWPASRKIIALSTWALATLALAWFAFYMYSANNTF